MVKLYAIIEDGELGDCVDKLFLDKSIAEKYLKHYKKSSYVRIEEMKTSDDDYRDIEDSYYHVLDLEIRQSIYGKLEGNPTFKSAVHTYNELFHSKGIYPRRNISISQRKDSYHLCLNITILLADTGKENSLTNELKDKEKELSNSLNNKMKEWLSYINNDMKDRILLTPSAEDNLATEVYQNIDGYLHSLNL